jgi:hypothetical protein
MSPVIELLKNCLRDEAAGHAAAIHAAFIDFFRNI